MNDLRPQIPLAFPKVASLLNSVITSTGLDLGFDISESKQDSPVPDILNVRFTGPTPHFLRHVTESCCIRWSILPRRSSALPPKSMIESRSTPMTSSGIVIWSCGAAAEDAIKNVQSTGRPYAFPPMNSRERRMLHLLLSESGLPTASSGENPRRYVILYPEGHSVGDAAIPAGRQNEPSAEDRARAIRKSFRSR